MSLAFQSLEIELSRCRCGQREVRILDSPIDRPRNRLLIDDANLDLLQRNVDGFDKLLLKSGFEHRIERRILAEEIGGQLFELIAPGRVGACLRESMRLLERDRERGASAYRIRFSFGQSESYDPALARLPWELLRDAGAEGRFLGIELMTQSARCLEISRAVPPLAVEPPLRILAVLSSPTDQPEVDLEAQELAVRRAIEGSDGLVEVEFLARPTLQQLISTLEAMRSKGKPAHGLHFLGHGELTAAGDGALYFETEARSQHVVRASVLASQISRFESLRLVMLATCSGARLPRRDGQNPFTGSASALIAANIPAVVAMQFNISEAAAATFSEAFYSKLAQRSTIDEAVAEGRAQIQIADVEGFEWATPVLFLRSPDGVLFEPPREETEPPGEVNRIRQQAKDLEANEGVLVVGVDGGERAADVEQALTGVKGQKTITLVGRKADNDRRA